MKKKSYISTLLKPSDVFLPAAFFIASLLGRPAVALKLFAALYGVKLLALSSSNGLRMAFARQPSMKYVQGSAAVALLLQLAGAAIAALALFLSKWQYASIALVLCGLLLNIEHVFYEYLYAAGDAHSATLCRGITAILTLAGMLLCAPPASGLTETSAPVTACLLVTSGLSALVGLAVSLALGGKLRPRMNIEVLRCAPRSMLQTAFYSILATLCLYLLLPSPDIALPLFAGLILYEPFRLPFRRSPSEAGPMNRMLLILCVAASACGLIGTLALSGRLANLVALCCGALIFAALCTMIMFGNIGRRGMEEA